MEVVVEAGMISSPWEREVVTLLQEWLSADTCKCGGNGPHFLEAKSNDKLCIYQRTRKLIWEFMDKHAVEVMQG